VKWQVANSPALSIVAQELMMSTAGSLIRNWSLFPPHERHWPPDSIGGRRRPSVTDASAAGDHRV